MNTMMRFASGAALALCAWSSPASATLQWQSYNTCWADFDVGGGWFCGLRSSQCTSTAQLYCSAEYTSTLPPAYSAAAPAAKAVALDSAGYVWLTGNDNRIYVEDGNRNFPAFSPAVPATCVQKLAVSGSTGNNPRVLALACNGTLYRFLDGQWYVQRSSGVVDVSVTSSGTLTYLVNTDNFSYSGPNGGGMFINLGAARPTETFPGGSHVFLPITRLGGGTGWFDEFWTCHNPSTSVGTAKFYSFFSSRLLVGDPGGCDHLQVTFNEFSLGAGSSPIALKLADGGRGPASDHLWILTNIGRVLSLNDVP